MSPQSVRAFFASRDLNLPIIELEVSTATVALAAEAHGVEPGRIAKTLAFRLGDGRAIVLVARGDARIDNRRGRHRTCTDSCRPVPRAPCGGGRNGGRFGGSSDGVNAYG